MSSRGFLRRFFAVRRDGGFWVCDAGHRHAYRRNAVKCNDEKGGIP